jgi:phage terminase large subunit
MKIETQDLQNLVHYLKVPNINGNSRHILDRFIRRIHSVNEFKLTDLAESKLKELNLFKSQYLTNTQRQKLNRKFKQIGFDDVLTIEHLYSVKKMIDDMILLREKFDGKIDEVLVHEYLVDKTYCVYKLDIAEKELQG